MEILMIVLQVVVWVFKFVLTTWTLYLASTAILWKREDLQEEGKDFVWQQKVLGYAVLGIGAAVNISFNYTVAWVVFWEKPKSLFFTDRLQNHMHEPGYRGRLSRSICKYFLDPFEIGGHC